MQNCSVVIKSLLIFLLVFNSGSASPELDNIKNFFSSINDINAFISNPCDIFMNIKNISKSCAIQLKILCEDENKMTLLKMLDSTAFPIYSGMLYSSPNNLGNFDECLSIEYKKDGFKILGNYCPIGYVLPGPNGEIYKYAICKPDKCSFEDILNIFNYNNTLEEFKYKFLDEIGPFEQYCSTKEWEQLTLGNIITIGIFIVFGVVIIISTFYDVLCEIHKNKKQPYCIAFSAYTNTKKIFCQVNDSKKGHITILDGLRSLSMFWIFTSHGYLVWEALPLLTNFSEIPDFLNSNGLHVFIGSYICVDTFFFMSGMLSAYIYFKSETPPLTKQLKNIPIMYCYRIFRLILPPLMLFLFVLWIFPIIYTGPYLKLLFEVESEKCKNHWLAFFTFTQNYAVPNEEVCMGPTWYLAADMQMFVFSPIILIPLSLQLKNTKVYLIAIFELLGLTILTTGLYVGFTFSHPETNNFNTHSRIVDYLIGIMMGIYLRKGNKNHFNILNKHYLYIFIWIAVLICMSVVWWKQEFHLGHMEHYLVYYRILWCFCLCWIIYASCHGYGGLITWFLNRPIFQIISKLSYSIYLLHYVTISRYVLSLREKVHLSHYHQLYLTCGFIVENLFISFLWTIAFDMPIGEIINIWFKNRRT